MVANKITYTDKEGNIYKFPERSCKRCLNYPCLANMHLYKSDFAKYGCINYKDENIFE